MSTTLTKPAERVAIDVLESVQTIVDFDSRHDEKNHVIRGVKFIGNKSKNNRGYAKKAIRRVKDLAEGAIVCINHPDKDKITEPRGWGERWGVMRNTVENGVEGTGDLHYNPNHPLTPAIIYDLRHGMGGGLSINGRLVMTPGANGVDAVEDVTILRSIDLVLKPATTRDLFESEAEELSLRDKLALLTSDSDLTDDTLRERLAELIAQAPAETPAEEPTEQPSEGDQPAEKQVEPAAVEQITEVLKSFRDEIAGTVGSLTQRLDAIEQQSQLSTFCASRGGSFESLTPERQQLLRDATEGERETLWDSWAPAARGAVKPLVGGKNATEGVDEATQPTEPAPGSAPLGPRKIIA